MQSLWNDDDATAIENEQGQLGLRVYSSRLLGQCPDLVLHGGGNTSLKGHSTTVFAENLETLYVKGSGWDLKTIERGGFPPVAMDHLLRLGELDELSDTQMMCELRLALLDPAAPTPSVEAILHALIPFRFVDHTHTDAVVTLSNSVGGPERLAELYGEEVLILPYCMPGFELAKQVAEATKNLEWSSLRGIVLLNHGLFTFADDAKTSYHAMIELVTRAEELIQSIVPKTSLSASHEVAHFDTQGFAALRNEASIEFGAPLLLSFDESSRAREFAARDDAPELIVSGPLTPDHTIHTKPFGAFFEQDPIDGLRGYIEDYRSYFNHFARSEHQCLDPLPRYAVWADRGLVHLAPSVKRLGIVEDITEHTIAAMMIGEQLGGWQPLERHELFEVEYWELEQAKLRSNASATDPARELEGKIALVTGAASGIGYATARRLLSAGAAIVALDRNPAVEFCFDGNPSVLALCCDVTERDEIESALSAGIKRFGGLDILVSNAGLFPPSQPIEALEDEQWEASLAVNVSAPMHLLRSAIPYLKLGFDPSVIFVGSKNVPAPGPGAAAYSSAKSALTQLARVAALELGECGIRVNTLHPDAVYDTALWSEEVLASRAAAYGMSVQEYKTKNLLASEVSSADVAEAVFLFAGSRLAKTTGAQLPVDGGNARVV